MRWLLCLLLSVQVAWAQESVDATEEEDSIDIGVIVVEASSRSGALITARMASEANRAKVDVPLLSRAVQERIESMDVTDPLTRRIHIKMSGCPNGCSQHHIGNIGFYGASIKVGEHTIPAYVAHIGGNYEGGEIVYGKRLKVRLASKRVPEAVERWIRFYEAERYNESEVFNAFAERVGPSAFEDLVRDLAMPIEFGLETMEHFIDWTKNVPFQVIRGEGECAV